LAVGREDFVATVDAVLVERSPSLPEDVASWQERARAFGEALTRARTSHRRSQRLRVVFVDHCAKLSGGELALARVIPALEGFELRAILGEDGPLVERLHEAGAIVEVVPLDSAVRDTRRTEVRVGAKMLRRAIATWKDIRVLRRRLQELEPDIVHTNSLKAAIYGGIAGKLAGIRVVWHIRDRIARDYLPLEAVIAVKFLALFVPDALVFNSAVTRRTCRVPVMFSVIPSPVIHDGATQDVPLSGKVDAASTPMRFAMVGRLAPWKGQEVFLRAFAQAFGEGPETAVIAGSAMFGETDYATGLQKLAADLGIEPQVEFLGFVDDIPLLLANSNALVHASLIPEPFGQVVVEGMAAGLPVLASDSGGPTEVITPEVDGLLVPVGDVNALATQMLRLRDQPLLRSQLGSAARLTAQEYTPDRVARSIEEVWRNVAAPQRHRRH
jgi:glycosyltransferase involved in cell wall biosynthesis